MNAKDIAAKKFSKSTMGYKPEEVDEYLRDIALAYAKVIKEKEENEAKIVKLVEKINEYRNDEDAIKDALLTAQKQGNRILADAKAKAEEIVNEAQAKHDAMVAEIAGDCEKIKVQEVEKVRAAIKEENDKLNAVVAASKTQIEMQTDKLNKLKNEVNTFKKTLISLLYEQTKLANALPELTDEQIETILSTEPSEAPTPKEPEVEPGEKDEPIKEEKKPEPKVTADTTFGFSSYKRQNYSTSELKFGHNGNNNK